MGSPGQMGRQPGLREGRASFTLDGETCEWLKPDPCHKWGARWNVDLRELRQGDGKSSARAVARWMSTRTLTGGFRPAS
jgi:hypothetical protein